MAKIVIFSGAGVSAESGLSTFRDAGGLWEEYRIEEICTAGCLSWNRAKTIEFYNKRREQLLSVEPNAAHFAIAEFANAHQGEVCVMTQNVDDLFERAGCRNVVHLHGFLPELRCERCEETYHIGYKAQSDEKCLHCEGKMRPNIVFFGEAAPMYAELYRQMEDCEFLAVIGTSGNVVNMDNFAKSVKFSILNNLEPSEAINTKRYSKVLYKPATKGVLEILELAKKFREGDI